MARAACAAVALCCAAFAAGAADPVRAKQIIGMEVRAVSGAALGHVEDLLVDQDRVAFVVVFAGGRERNFPVERIVVEGDKVVLAADGARPAGSEGGLQRATGLLEGRLVDKDGGVAGTIQDLMVKLDDARITHVVVDMDPSWSEKSGWVALPMQSVRPQGRDFLANFDPEHMRPAGSAAAARAKAAAAPVPERDARISQLAGRSVMSTAGAALGKVTDVVVDLRERRIHLVLVDTGGGAPLGCRIADDGLAIEIEKVKLRGAAQSLAEAGACAKPDWPRGEGAETPRYLLASELLRARMIDPSDSAVGTLRDVIVRESGELHYIVAAFQPSWVQAGKVVALPLRPARAEKEGLAMTASLVELQAMPIFDEKRLADVWSPAFAKGMEQYLYKR